MAKVVDISKPFDTVTRPCPDVQEPAREIFDHSKVFIGPNKIDVDALSNHFIKEGRINIEDILQIIKMAMEIFRSEPNVLDITDEVRVAGDLHGLLHTLPLIFNLSFLFLGSYYDFLKLLEIGGNPAEQCYLFLGDYVDRGYFCCELLIHMLALKIMYPNKFFMLRGNHECRALTEFFTFKKECLLSTLTVPVSFLRRHL